jgi:hypothetical protein
MEENNPGVPGNKRPFFLSILCTVVFVYSAVFILIFLSVAVFSNWVWYVLTDFFSEVKIEKSFIFWLSITGLALYILSFTGAFFIWKMKRLGFYIYAASSFAIAIIPFIFGLGSVINVIVFGALIFCMGFFFRKFT